MDILNKTLSCTSSNHTSIGGINNELPLLRINDLINASSVSESFSESDWNNLIIIKDWIFNYLMQSHKDLGRAGPVCPFVPKAVHENSIYLTIISADHFDKTRFYQCILNYRDQFNQLPPTTGNKRLFRSIILLIDIKGVNLDDIVERAISDLKPQFVENKLMLGEFHSGPPENKGIRNPDFKPLRSPLPLLVIRTMVETDIEFLKANPEYMEHYNIFFPGENIP